MDGVLVGHGDPADCPEQHAPRNADALGRFDDAVERRLHVFGGQFCAIMELHPLAQEECVGLGVLGYLPTMREIGDDGLAAVARIVPDEVVEHAALCAEAVDRAGLVYIEVRWAHRNAIAQDTAALGVGLGCSELELRSVELVRYRGKRTIRKQACRHSGASPENAAAGPARMHNMLAVHVASLRLLSLFCLWWRISKRRKAATNDNITISGEPRLES